MNRIESNGLVYDQFTHFSHVPWLFQGCFTRKGGISSGRCEGLNVGLHTGDDAAAVHANRQKILAESGGHSLVVLSQVHGNKVVVHPKDTPDFIEADAVITASPGAMLTILTADCQAVMLVDPEKKVVANAHSGWKGSVAGVLQETVNTMVSEFGCRPESLLAGIGPSLGPCCAEFVHHKRELPRDFRGHRVGMNHFDFWAISRDQLCSVGVKAGHIKAAQLCTLCDSEHYYSYRRDHSTGRLASVVGIRPDVTSS